MNQRTMARDLPELLEKIREIYPIIRKNAEEGENKRHVLEETIDAMAEIGVFRGSVPTRFGGFAADTKTQVEIAKAVAFADGSTGWITGLLNSGAYVTSLFSEQAQEDVFGSNPDNRVSIVLAASSHAEKADGGYRVTGEWRYNSGSWHSQWAILGMPLHNEAGEFEDNAIALIPREELEYEETWFVAGMKATASNSFMGKNIFVPEHRIFRVSPAIEGEYPGTTDRTEAPYRASLVPVLEIQLLGPHLGMGRAVLEIVREQAPKKGIAYTTFERQAD